LFVKFAQLKQKICENTKGKKTHTTRGS